MWSSSGQEVSNLSWHLALFSDVSSEETSLRKTNNVELTLEIWVGSDLSARFLSNSLEIVENFTEGWNTNFNAVNLGTSSLGHDSVDLDVSWVDASITESVEHSGWNSRASKGLLNP